MWICKIFRNYSGRNTHLLRVRVWISKFGMLCALRRRRIFMAQSVTVHGSEQLPYFNYFLGDLYKNRRLHSYYVQVFIINSQEKTRHFAQLKCLFNLKFTVELSVYHLFYFYKLLYFISSFHIHPFYLLG